MTTHETSVMDELRNLTECSICNSMISDPRGLPCIHTFCLKCLKNFESSSHRKPGDKMLCPVCRKEFTIPPEGMNGLQKNFFVERLAELMKISKPFENMSRCDVCQVSSDGTETELEATEYCTHCREKLCSHCSKEHLRNKFTRNHQIILIGCDVTEILADKHYSSVCDLHPGEKTKMYCVDCKVVICMMCFAESHNSHKCMDVRKAGEKFQEEIENDIKKLLDFPREALDRKEQLVKEKKKFIKELQDTERMIKLKCEELKDMVDKHATDLLDELNSVEQRKFKFMETRKEEVERHLESIDRFTIYSKEIISRGSPSDICRAVNDLRRRADELQTLHEIHIRPNRPSASVFFNEMKLQGLLHANNIIGKIVEKEETEKVVKVWKENISTHLPARRTAAICIAVLVSMLAIIVFRCFHNSNVNHVTRLNMSCDHVLSVTFSKSAINVLCRDPKRVFIYEDQSPFKLQKLILLDWVIEPAGMAASPASDYLYVADSGNKCIWMISRNGTWYFKTQWLTDDDLRLQSLSRDGSTILATNMNLLELKLYSTELGVLFHSFELPENIYPIQHAVETSTGDFIASYGWRKSDTKGICKVSRDGDIVQCYKATNESQELNYPIHVSLTSDDQVIVADTHNDRVLLLNSDLSWNRVLLTRDDDGGMIKPKILSYNNEKKILVVANFEGNINIYNSNITGP